MTEGWLKDKGIVIIGGTSGMGLSAARAFLAEGAGVVAVGRDDDNVTRAAQQLSGAHVMPGDATGPDTAERAIEACLERFGRFDGLYHVAGGSGRRFGDGPLHEITAEGWEYTLTQNLTSLMYSNQAAVRAFLQRRTAGSILNMASVLAWSPSPRYFATHAYAAAKAAIVGFSKSVAAHYAAHNIRVNVIAPGLVETPMAQRATGDPEIQAFIRTKQPLAGGRIGNPKDLDGAAIYLLSDRAVFTTGQLLAVDGGWELAEGQYKTTS